IAVAAAAATTAPPAFAARSYDSQVGGFDGVNGMAFDSSGDLWVADHEFPLHEYSPYPSQTLIKNVDTQAAFGFGIRETDVAVDQSTGEVLEAQANCRSVGVFEGSKLVITWTGINGITVCNPGDIHIASDNSATNSRGRIYLSLAGPEN